MPGCNSCGQPDFVWEEVEGAGTVVNASVMHLKIHPAFTPPYVVVVVELTCGVRILSRLVHSSNMPQSIVGELVSVRWLDLPDANTSLPLFELVSGEDP
jgi:uncharacterized protein